MIYSFDKDINSLKNAIFYFFTFLISSVGLLVIELIVAPMFEKLVAQIIFYVALSIFVLLFALFAGYLAWYIIMYLVTKNKILNICNKKGEEYVLVQLNKKTNVKILKDELDFASAKEMWAPIKGVNPNKLIVKRKDGSNYKVYFLEEPGQCKGLINSIIRGKEFKE